jgi:hypothetical protein
MYTGQLLNFSGTWHVGSDDFGTIDGAPVQGEITATFAVPAAVFENDFVITRPFTMTGLVSATRADGAKIPSFDIFGTGEMRAFFHPNFFSDGSEHGFYDSVNFNFSQTAPTPEPGTLALVGCCAVAALVRRSGAGRRHAVTISQGSGQ